MNFEPFELTINTRVGFFWSRKQKSLPLYDLNGHNSLSWIQHRKQNSLTILDLVNYQLAGKIDVWS